MAINQLVIGGVPEHFNLPWHLAIESGAFHEAGMDVTYRDFPGGTGEMTRALARQEIDLAILLAEGAVADIVAHQRSRIVKVYVDSPLIWGIHVAADSDIRHVDQIRDRCYAISRRGSGSHLMAIVDAAERGWDSTCLDFRTVRTLDGARQALAEGTADTFFWEKYTTMPYVESGEFRQVGHRETLWPAFVIAAEQNALDEKQTAIRQALELVNQSAMNLMQNPDAASMVADRYGLLLSDVEQWLALTQWNVDFQRPTRAIETILAYMNRLGIVADPDARPRDVWHSLDS